MGIGRPARLLLICLVWQSSIACADEPYPFISAAAIPPQNPPGLPNERPTELPNIRGDDLPSFIPPPSTKEAPKPATPSQKPDGPPSDYNPSLLYLPDRNPGLRQPPCPCLPAGLWWINASYFLGITQDGSVPNLATGGTTGIVNAPGTHVLFGNDRLDHPFRSGMQLETGIWLDRCHNWAVEGSFFFLDADQVLSNTTATGSTLLSRPFINAATNAPSSLILQNPSSFSTSSPVSFLGAGVNLRRNLFCEDDYRLDFTGGYRFVSLGESFTATSDETLSNGGSRQLEDSFKTNNQFHGLQVGFAGEYRLGKFYLDGGLKVAFGVNFANLDTEGHTTDTLGTISNTTVGGFLTGPGNLGQWSYARFAVAPEATFVLGYQITEHWRTFVGYNFVYLSQVARPGQAIDTVVGVGPGGVQNPQLRDPITTFWMQGINLGLEARY